jgi:predicted secreted protein with PEFG-CTERM motif
MDYKAYALMAILLASVASVGLVSAAYAQTTSVTVETDKASYTSGENITISGTVTNVQQGQPVLIRVTNPLGALARTEPVTVAADGSWTYTFPSGGPLMRPSGDYEVQVTYRGITEETTFSFTGTETAWIPFTVNIGGNNYTIRYQISGGSVSGMTADVELSTLTVALATTADGTLQLQLPRNVIQALSVEGQPTGGSDVDYFAFADSIPADAEETSPATGGAGVREISIDFEQGTEEIEVVGTWIVPEFGVIAAIVLAVAIVGIIVATTRYGKFNSFAPRL